MPTNRDDFSTKTKELLAKRIGYRCSNPACRKLTCEANDNPSDFTYISVAAHICAAADGGRRYDRNMSSDERKNYANGIWLCQSCSKLIDSDISRYTVDKLNLWKSIVKSVILYTVRSRRYNTYGVLTLQVNAASYSWYTRSRDADLDSAPGNNSFVSPFSGIKRLLHIRYMTKGQNTNLDVLECVSICISEGIMQEEYGCKSDGRK